MLISQSVPVLRHGGGGTDAEPSQSGGETGMGKVPRTLLLSSQLNWTSFCKGAISFASKHRLQSELKKLQ